MEKSHKQGRTHLTDLEERFALEFVKCRNKRQAYLAAGYKSQKTTQLNSIRASELFNKPHVRERIRELTDKTSIWTRRRLKKSIATSGASRKPRACSICLRVRRQNSESIHSDRRQTDRLETNCRRWRSRLHRWQARLRPTHCHRRRRKWQRRSRRLCACCEVGDRLMSGDAIG
jgi:hypothetical protein